MNQLKLAVIGEGHLGRIHARLAKTLPEVELLGVADPSPEARRLIEEQLELPTIDDYRFLLAHIDAAIVAAPTGLHGRIGCELLESGIHVLMEKPIASSIEEADRLIDAADRNGCVLAVGHVERFNPAFRAARPHIVTPRYLESVRASGYTFRSTDVGVVHDLMIHDLDIVLSLVESPVADVRAIGAPVFGPHEDMARAWLTFADGAVACLAASRTSYEPMRTLKAIGPEGFISVDFGGQKAETIRPCEELRQGRIDPGATPPERKEYIKQHLFDEFLPRRPIEIQPGNALLDEIADFVAAVREKVSPRVTGRQGREALLVAEQIVGQIAAGRQAEPDTIPAFPEPATIEQPVPRRKAG